MTFEIPRHVETVGRRDGAAAPGGLSLTASRFSSADFSVLDLADGGTAALVIHRIPGPLPGKSARLQYRLGGGDTVDLPQPVEAGVHLITGFTDGEETPVCLRVSDFDVATGAEAFGEWSPAKAVTTTRFSAENLLSYTVDPTSDAVGRWAAGTVWAGPPDVNGFTTLTSASAAQPLDQDELALLSAGPVTVLAQLRLREESAAEAVLRLSGTAAGGGAIDVAVRLTWASDAVDVAASNGASAITALLVERDATAGTARLLMVATLDTGASGLSYQVEGAGNAIARPELRVWAAGNTAWPEPEAVGGITRAGRRVPPVVVDFVDETLEAVVENPESMPFTVFGDERADSMANPGRAVGIAGATVVASGSGYIDGAYDLAVAGGGGGIVRATVTGGAVTAAEVAVAGVRYAAPAVVALDDLPGGSGADVTVTLGTGRDYWPAVNDGATRAAWGGRALGQDDFRVEGIVVDGGFHSTAHAIYLQNQEELVFTSDGHWRAQARGATRSMSEDEGERLSVGVVISNGGVRRVLAMPLGFTGDAPRRPKIVAMPEIVGSGRWGDLLRVMPGELRDADPAAAAVSYEWLRDGVEITGETGETLRLTPSVAPLGCVIAARVTWAQGIERESWVTPGVTVATWKVVADGDALRFGRQTPAGLAGVPIGPAGTTITGGDGGDWVVAEADGIAFLRPAAGPSTPGSDPVTSGEGVLASSYALTLSDGRGLAVTTEPDAYTVNGVADMAAIAQASGAAAGQSVFAFDFGSGGRIVAWNGGDWGGVDDPANPLSRLTDLVLVGGDADGGASQLLIEPYDPAEPTAVTGPVHIAEARNLSWRVDGVQAPALDDAGSVFEGARLFAITTAGRSVALEDCTIRGAAFMPERLARAADPAGRLLGPGMAPMVPGETPAITLRNLRVRDLGAVLDTALGAVTVEDCWIERCGARPLRLSLGAGAGSGAGVTLRRTALIDAIGAGRLNPGAWLEITPEGADGFAPLYRPGLPVTLEDVVALPGQTAAPAMAGIVLNRDVALGDGSAEEDYGVAYAPLTLRRVLMVTGADAGVALSSGETGVIEDVSIVADARAADALPAIRHDNPFRTLDAGFTITRSLAGAIAMAGAAGGDGGTVVTTGAYGAAFVGDPLERAPRDLTSARRGFRPRPGDAADPDASGAVDGAVERDGSLKAALSLPAASDLPWGVSSWGRAAMQSGIGWGAIPDQANGAFRIVASRRVGPAPLGVHFHLDGLTTEERLFDDFLWDFGPTEDYEFDALPLESRARRGARYGLGHATGHVFVGVGTHRITVTQSARDGSARSAEIEIEVQDPDMVFAGLDTVCLSLVGDFSGAPAGARQVTSWTDMRAVLQQNQRLLLRAGEEFEYDGVTFDIDESLYVSRFGDAEAPRPRISPAPTQQTASVPFVLLNAQDVLFAGVEYRDFYDPTDPIPAEEHPEYAILRRLFVPIGTSPGTVIFGCKVSNCAGGPGIEPRGLLVNNDVSDWYNYGSFSEDATEAAFIGCRIAQNPNTADFLDFRSPNSGESPNGADHGPIRTARSQRCVIAQCHLESWSGWPVFSIDGEPSFSIQQPTIRFNVNRASLPEDGGVIVDNHLVGGFSIVTLGNTLTQTTPIGRSEGYLIARNFMEAELQTDTCVESAFPDTVVASNVFAKLRELSILPSPLGSIFVPRDLFNDVEATATPRYLIANTVDFDLQFRSEDLQVVRIAPDIADVVIDRDNAITVDQYANAASFGEIGPLENYAPLIGGPLDDAATGQPPVRDYRARVRPAVAARGALEPFSPEVLDMGADAAAVSVAAGPALAQSGVMTLVARVARDGAGSRQIVGLGAGGVELTSPSDQLRLALTLDDGSSLVDTVLDGIAPQGDFVSLMLAVDLAGGLSGGRTVSLFVDGQERYAQLGAARPLLADPTAAVLFGGSAAARLEHALWLDTANALDPAEHYGDFFGSTGTIRNLEPAGKATGVIPSVYYVAKQAGLGQPSNQGAGGVLIASGPVVTLL